MMKQLKKRSVTAFFATLLSVSLILSAFSALTPVSAEDTTETKAYRYSVEIEFGAMTFCYDYGTWNTSDLRYEADDSSDFPSSETIAGFPGWYGFDGTANKISVKYNNVSVTTDPTKDFLTVSIDYRALTAGEGGDSGVTDIEGVSMGLYGAADWSRYLGGSGTQLSVAKNSSIEVWLSLDGVPTVGTEAFRSQNLVPIGMLTITLGTFSATQGGN